MEKLLLPKSGKKIILLGNEAIVRGALEAGVQFVSTYPGTPASEIGDTFARISREGRVYMEYSVNEKVALEAAIGASFSGLKCLVAMKSFGLNVAADSLLPFCYTGSKGPTVIVIGDDPSCWSSAQSEQDSRAYCYLAHLPTLEPSDPQECKDFTKLAFQISEKFKLPVMIRTTTRVAHQRAPVIFGEIRNSKFEIRNKFQKDPKKWVTMPPRVLEMKKELLEKIEKIKEFFNQLTTYNLQLTAKNGLGIITSGVSYLYVMEALGELNLSLPVLKLGFFYPLPEEKIKDFIKKLKKVLIAEELEPYLEKEIQRLAKDSNPKLEIFGKSHLPEVGELRPEHLILAIAKIIGKKYQIPNTQYPISNFLKHLPRFCTGKGGSCPYWKLFAAVKKAAPKNTIFGGDIGCYMMAALPPHNLYDYLSCMGSSIGIAHGIKKATGQKLITFIGDSTFFHAGIPALINTVFNKSNPLIIILDNRTTAMTGHQPHPGIGKTGMGEETLEIKIEDILAALKIKHWKVIDPETNFEEMVKTIREFLTKKEVSVIVARKICWLLAQRQKNEKKS